MTIQLKKIFARENKGILVDLILFVIQLVLMRVLVLRLADLIDQAKEDTAAKAMVGGFCFALCFLQPIGILLKRYGLKPVDAEEQKSNIETVENFGLYYFVSQLILVGAGISFVLAIFNQQQAFDYFCLGQLVLSILVASLNLWIVKLYFRPVKHKTLQKLLGMPQAELLGDLLILLNLILWQMLWGFLVLGLSRETASVPNEFVWLSVFMPQKELSMLAKLGWFCMALFVFYLSPRLIYLIHDRQRKLAWLTILLANLPVIYRILFPRQ